MAASVEKVGILESLLVRPLRDKPGEYELLDGKDRAESVKDKETEVPVVVIRSDIKDSDVFRLSEETFERTDRSACEMAQFYKEWARTLEKETGESEGVQALLAQETGKSDSAISQYMAIYDLFERLKSLAPDEEFNALKSWSVNKLYALSELGDCPNLLAVAGTLEREGGVSFEEVERVVRLNRPKNSALDEVEQGDYRETTIQAERARVLATEVNSIAPEINQLLLGVADDVLQGIDQFSSTDILEIFDKVLRILKRLRKRVEKLRRRMDQVPKPVFREKLQEDGN
jgi:ParB/RepB/Spo0J family partition protein